MSPSENPEAASSEVMRLAAVMDTLRSDGGCPWDRAQTHASLAPFALEEAYEVVEAIEARDAVALREELGDLLLQVVFHARVAEESPTDPFDLADVARGITEKLMRRHPQIFPVDGRPTGPAPSTAEAQHVSWDRIKQAEKSRESVLDGIPAAQGSLARAQKVVGRTRRAGLEAVLVPDAAATGCAPVGTVAPDRAGLGERLLALVIEAEQAGLDAEGELRRTTSEMERRVRAVEKDPNPTR